MGRSPLFKTQAVALLLAVASLASDTAFAGLTQDFTFADRRFGPPATGTTLDRNVDESSVDNDFDANSNDIPAVPGQNVTLGGISLTFTAAGGAGTQRFNLADNGLGVRGIDGVINPGESISFNSPDPVVLTQLIFSQTTSESRFSLSVDGTTFATIDNMNLAIIGGTNNLLASFTTQVVGNSFTIAAIEGQGRIAQLSVAAVPEPSTLAMAVCGSVVGLGWSLRRHRRNRPDRTGS